MEKITSQQMSSTSSSSIKQIKARTGKAVAKTQRGGRSADREVNTRKPSDSSYSGKSKTGEYRSRPLSQTRPSQVPFTAVGAARAVVSECAPSRDQLPFGGKVGTVGDNLNAGFQNQSQGSSLSTAVFKKGGNTAKRPHRQGRLPSDVNHDRELIFDSVTQIFYRRKRRSTKTPSIWDKLPDGFTLLFFGINVVFLGMGIGMISIGAIKMVEDGDLRALFNFDLSGDIKTGSFGVVQAALLLMITSGVMVTVLSVLGVVSVLCSSVFALYAYIFILMVPTLANIFIIALAFYFHEVLSNKLAQPLRKVLVENYDGDLNSTNAISRGFDYGQVLLGCCGATSYKDFQQTKWVQKHPEKRLGPGVTGTFPLTCCRLKDPAAFLKAPTKFNFSVGFNDHECPHRVASSDNEYTGTPCDEKVKQTLLTQVSIIYFIALAAFCLELVGISSAYTVSREIKLQG